MKCITTILFLIAFLLCTLSITAQETKPFTIDTSYGGEANKYIYRLLREGKADTVILFELPINYTYNSRPDSVYFLDIQFILYRSGNNTLIDKSSGFCGCTPAPGTVIPLSIQNDTLFSWLQQYMNVINAEEIAPFAVRHDYTHHPIYKSRRAFHASLFFITLITRDRKIRKNIYSDDFNKTWDDDMINLNYNYNTSLKLYQLLRMLEDRCKKTAQKN